MLSPSNENTTSINPSLIEEELKRIEVLERKALGLKPSREHQWHDTINKSFYADQRSHTTILVSGLTMAHDLFVKAALSGLGYKLHALDCPDVDALNVGKEYGNRGQCNPTYFTVGNLVKYLIDLRDKQGMSTQDIISKNVFLTAGACGPCRFGMYVTEYRKALRDAGFEGFRVMLFEPNGGMHQATGQEAGLRMDKEFFFALAKAIFTGDALNAIMYRIRPYEVEKGSTDRAVDQCKEVIMNTLINKKSLFKALWKSRKILQAIKVDHAIVKPKVSIIGEFWAMTTEGDGNYHLQKFLEQEGAEVDIQLIVNWLLYNIWQARNDIKTRMNLRGADTDARRGLKTTEVGKKFVTLWLAEKALRGVFYTFGKVLGLKNYHLPDMNENAQLAREHYNTELRGGEGHMEVGKLIQTVKHKKAHMVISVKPFGCMPSSGVSDGVQSLITEKYPEAIFLPIETTGDGAVNVYSRIQMMLFKAKQAAAKEFEQALVSKKISMEQLRKKAGARLVNSTHYSPHVVAGTAANLALEVA